MPRDGETRSSDGAKFRTIGDGSCRGVRQRLRDAANYITCLPKKESHLPEWQAAIEALMLVARNGPTMMARIGVMKALNRHVVRVFNPDRKDIHWGKRKLKRDQ